MENMLSNKAASRINYIDFLKVVGLTAIILAHVSPPKWANMLRGFDVQLMVILSSILANRSYSKHESSNTSIVKWYISRAKRLVIPAWIYLILYFLLLFVATRKVESIKYYIASFCLTTYGTGYVWVILIYLYSAMLIPLCAKIKLSIKGIIFVSLTYVLYEVAYYYQIGFSNSVVKAFLDTTIYNIIPYGALTFLGYNYFSIKKKTKGFIALVSFLIFIALVVYYYNSMGSIQLVSIVKHPPRLYYMSYGIACSFGLLLFCEYHNCKIFDNKIVRYISSHSMWIYLWHVLVLAVYQYLKLPQIWFVKLIILYTVSIIMVILVNKILDLIEKAHKVSFLKYLRC